MKQIDKQKNEFEKQNDNCFVIMPISDPDGYDKGHFQHVYDDIIKPAVQKSNFSPYRVDEAKGTNLIHVEILKELIDAPIAICDLSSRNPNVLFELGIRQAFDKPVVLIQESGTPRIFDISGLRCIDYSKNMKYHEVIHAQNLIFEAINETMKNVDDKSNMNSIVKLLAIEPAKIPSLDSNNKSQIEFGVLQSQIQEIRHLLLSSTQLNRANFRQEHNLYRKKLDSLASRIYRTPDDASGAFANTLVELENNMMTAKTEEQMNIYAELIELAQHLRHKAQQNAEIPF
ncbi:MAG: hypothetical protein EKK54_03085 [Neisseriaceae bacterium]|nr:MAG: hypothetical protein EKK54_03085 [Neisseriaceae bacterium]